MAMDQQLKIELSKQGVFVTTLEELYNWGRENSVWPLGFGLACCAIEMIAAVHGPLRPRPVRRRGLPALAAPGGPDDRGRHGDQEDGAAGGPALQPDAEPKYVIAMGACAISGGPFKQGYNVLKGIDRYIPVDVHIPGCPPRPEALLARAS